MKGQAPGSDCETRSCNFETGLRSARRGTEDAQCTINLIRRPLALAARRNKLVEQTQEGGVAAGVPGRSVTVGHAQARGPGPAAAPGALGPGSLRGEPH